MKAWFISGGLHFVIGLAAGWVIFKRPQWAQNLIDKIKAKFEGL